MNDTPIPVGDAEDRREALIAMISVATEEWEREERFGRQEIADALIRVAAMMRGKPL